MKNGSEDAATELSWWRKHLRPAQDDIAHDLWQLLYEYRWRIIWAVALLLLAKVATVVVPLILKRVIDEFSRPEQLAALPVYLLVGYALVRFSSTLFSELRDLLFSRVSQSTVAVYAQKTFAHLHTLGSRFHASRRTGGLLELSFPNGSKIVVNTQPPLHELWLAARSGGFHYRYAAGRWVDTKSGQEFFAELSARASEQAGRPLVFAAPAA